MTVAPSLGAFSELRAFNFYLFEQHFVVKTGTSSSDLARPYTLYHPSKYLLDNEMLLKQVKVKALSSEKAPRDGATVTCRAMYV